MPPVQSLPVEPASTVFLNRFCTFLESYSQFAKHQVHSQNRLNKWQNTVDDLQNPVSKSLVSLSKAGFCVCERVSDIKMYSLCHCVRTRQSKPIDNVRKNWELYTTICMVDESICYMLRTMRNWFYDVHRQHQEVTIEQTLLRISILKCTKPIEKNCN